MARRVGRDRGFRPRPGSSRTGVRSGPGLWSAAPLASPSRSRPPDEPTGRWRERLPGALLVAAALASAPAPLRGQDAPPAAPPAARRFDLAACLRLADQNHPNLLAARARVGQVRAQLLEARFAPFMGFAANGGMTLAPTVRGDSVFSPNTDVSLTSSLGVAWRASVWGVVPLWTFGKITNLWDAAEANVKVKQAELAVERDTVRLDVRKAYYGLLLAREGLALLDDADQEIAEQVKKLEPQVEQDEADPVDLLKLQTFTAELEVRRAEGQRFARVAVAGLRFYTGVSDLDIVGDALRPSSHRLGHLSRYLAAARLNRPEVQMARAGIAAREAQLRLGRAQLFPDLGVLLQAGISAAPEVADQINPFVSDGGNYFHYGLALVFQWKLDFVPQLARIRFAEAQLDEVMALDRKALGGVAVEVEQAYAEAIDWQQRRAAYEKAVKYAKRWLATVQQAIDVGTMEEKEIVEPSKSYALNRFNALNATMEHNLALARLAKATGWDAVAAEAR
ncbi:MAG: TolC family protein [Deltaproteobacteria bacterium]|nr:TolC family protein [Deltaproteobacteria bacterium]